MHNWELHDVFDVLGRLKSCTVDSQSSDRREAVPSRVKTGYHKMCSWNEVIDV